MNNFILFGPSAKRPIKGKVRYSNTTGDDPSATVDSLRNQVKTLNDELTSINNKLAASDRIRAAYSSWCSSGSTNKGMGLSVWCPSCTSDASMIGMDPGTLCSNFSASFDPVVSALNNRKNQIQLNDLPGTQAALDKAIAAYNALQQANLSTADRATYDAAIIKAKADADAIVASAGTNTSLKKWLTIGAITVGAVGLIFAIWYGIKKMEKAKV